MRVRDGVAEPCRWLRICLEDARWLVRLRGYLAAPRASLRLCVTLADVQLLVAAGWVSCQFELGAA